MCSRPRSLGVPRAIGARGYSGANSGPPSQAWFATAAPGGRRFQQNRYWAPVTCCAALLLLLPSCHTARRAPGQPPVPAQSGAELVQYIADQPYLTAEPACRAIHILAKGEPFVGEFDTLREKLRAEGLIGRHWQLQPDQLVTRGQAGFMICRACDIRGGLNWSLTGLERYAWRELQHRRIAGEGSESGFVSGGEFVGLLARVEEHLRKQSLHTSPPVEIGDRP